MNRVEDATGTTTASAAGAAVIAATGSSVALRLRNAGPVEKPTKFIMGIRKWGVVTRTTPTLIKSLELGRTPQQLRNGRMGR